MGERDEREQAPGSGQDDASVRPADVTGALAAMPLTEILQNMDFARRTVRVWLRRGDDTGVIHIEHGQVVRAETRDGANRQAGEGAVIALCCWSRGTFSLYFEHEPVLPNVERPTMLVLLDAMRVIDEQSGGIPVNDGSSASLAPSADGSGDDSFDGGDAGGDADDGDVGLDDFRNGGVADDSDNRGLGSLEDGEITDALDAALGDLGALDGAGDAGVAAAFPAVAVDAPSAVEPDVEVPVPPTPSPPPEPLRERPPPLPSRRASLVTSVDLTATATTATTTTPGEPAPPAPAPAAERVVEVPDNVFVPIATDTATVEATVTAIDGLAVAVGVHGVDSSEAVWAPTLDPVLDPLPEAKRVRWTPRVKVGLAASFRLVEEAGWWSATVTDLSIGGAFLACTVPCAPDRRMELHVQLLRHGFPTEVLVVMAQVVRSSGDGVGVRFMQLSAELAGRLAALVKEAMDHGPGPMPWTASAAAAPQPTVAAPELVDVDSLLSAVGLRERSIYELLRVDPLCPDTVLATGCQALIERVERDGATAEGHRASSLMVLHTSLARLRPLWSDPVKRLRYDFRWGHVRAAERIEAARRGHGVSLKILAEVWSSLYPERVRKAEALLTAAQPTTPAAAAAAREADELDPFCRLYRQGASSGGPHSSS